MKYLILNMQNGLMDGYYSDKSQSLRLADIYTSRTSCRWLVVEVVDGQLPVKITDDLWYANYE